MTQNQERALSNAKHFQSKADAEMEIWTKNGNDANIEKAREYTEKAFYWNEIYMTQCHA